MKSHMVAKIQATGGEYRVTRYYSEDAEKNYRVSFHWWDGGSRSRTMRKCDSIVECLEYITSIIRMRTRL